MIRRLAIAGLLATLAFVGKPERTLFWDAVFDAGHVPLFGVIALLVRREVAAKLGDETPAGASWLAFGITFALGLATEVVQSVIPHRDAAWLDLARNCAGAASFLLLRGAWAPGPGCQTTTWGRTRLGAASAGALLVMLSLVEVADTLVVLHQRARALPTLVAFDGSHWESRLLRVGANRITPAGSERWEGVPEGFARLDLMPARYSGFAIEQPYPDWRSYRELVFEVVLDTDVALPLSLRIHDARHDNRYDDRFNTAFRLTAGRHALHIPLDAVRRAPDRREMDMGRIRDITLFVARLDRPAHLYLGPMRLE